MNGTKFLNRNSRTSMVSRHLPGPTTLSPTTPVCGQQPPPLLQRDQQLLAQLRHLVQQLPQPRARHAQQLRAAARDAGDDHRPAGQQIDVARELSRPVRHDIVPITVRRVDDLDRAAFDDEQVEVGVAGPENRLAVLKRAARSPAVSTPPSPRHRAQERRPGWPVVRREARRGRWEWGARPDDMENTRPLPAPLEGPCAAAIEHGESSGLCLWPLGLQGLAPALMKSVR